MSQANIDIGFSSSSSAPDELYRSLVDAMEEGVVVQDLTGRVVAYNQSALEALGLSASQLLGTTSADPRWRAVQEDGTPFDPQDHPSAVTRRTGEARSRVLMGVYRPDGDLRWLSVSSRPIAASAGHAASVLVTFLDVTTNRRTEHALAGAIAAANEGRRRFEQIAILSPSTIYILDFKRRVPIYTNRNAAHSLGYTEEQVRALGESFGRHVAHPDDADVVVHHFDDLATLADGAVIELITRVRHASGHWRWVLRRETVLSRHLDGSPREILGNASDITEVKEAEQRLDALARTDSLTGVPNVRVIRERLGLMLAECRRGRRLALLMVDVDHFKRLNDTYGHGAGDKALREVAFILQSNVRATDMVGRWGGEEFCVLLADVDEHSAVLVADKLRLALHDIQIPCPVTASFGVTLLSPADRTLEETMERADRALYGAKQKGRDRSELAPDPLGSQLLLGASWRGSRPLPA